MIVLETWDIKRGTQLKIYFLPQSYPVAVARKALKANEKTKEHRNNKKMMQVQFHIGATNILVKVLQNVAN